MATKHPQSDEKKRLASVKDAIVTDMFDDMYKKRGRVYRMNFFRGIFFGLGSTLGGTVVVAFILWLLSKLIDWPFVSRIIETLQK
jgi:hypothetical protein